MDDTVWAFLIGVVVGALIGVFLTAILAGAPDPEDDRGGFDDDDEN